jgi:hypothetical protein
VLMHMSALVFPHDLQRYDVCHVSIVIISTSRLY